MPQSIQPIALHQNRCLLGEGPVWHDDHIWWVDIERGMLSSSDIHGNLKESVAFGQRVGSVVPVTRRTMMAALEREIVELDLDAKTWRTLVKPEGIPDGSRFNDGKCDPCGRWIVGTMNHAGLKTESLYSLHHGRTLRRLRGGVTISNGVAWTGDGATLYYIDTTALCVFAYDYNLELGTISNERVILKFSEKDGWPDGMAIDREGRLWIAFWDGWSVRCYHPKTGACEAVITLPCSRPTSCCFGGEDLDRLFITTASIGLAEHDLQQQPLAGSLFVCDPQAAGYSAVAARLDTRK